MVWLVRFIRRGTNYVIAVTEDNIYVLSLG